MPSCARLLAGSELQRRRPDARLSGPYATAGAAGLPLYSTYASDTAHCAPVEGCGQYLAAAPDQQFGYQPQMPCDVFEPFYFDPSVPPPTNPSYVTPPANMPALTPFLLPSSTGEPQMKSFAGISYAATPLGQLALNKDEPSARLAGTVIRPQDAQFGSQHVRDASVCLLRPASAPAWVHPTTTDGHSGPIETLVNATAAVHIQDSDSLPERAESVPLFQKGGGLLPLFSNPTKEQQDVACVFNQSTNNRPQRVPMFNVSGNPASSTSANSSAQDGSLATDSGISLEVGSESASRPGSPLSRPSETNLFGGETPDILKNAIPKKTTDISGESYAMPATQGLLHAPQQLPQFVQPVLYNHSVGYGQQQQQLYYPNSNYVYPSTDAGYQYPPYC